MVFKRIETGYGGRETPSVITSYQPKKKNYYFRYINIIWPKKYFIHDDYGGVPVHDPYRIRNMLLIRMVFFNQTTILLQYFRFWARSEEYINITMTLIY